MTLLIITSFFATILSKKLCDYIYPEKMNLLYIKITLYGFKIYATMHLLSQRVIKLFYNKPQNHIILFIKNGHEVKECNKEQFKLHTATIYNYDLILYKELNTSTDTYNVVRLDKNVNEENIRISNIKFIDIQVECNGATHCLDFGNENYYIEGNILFDKAFIVWVLNHYYGVTLTGDYKCTIMDNNVNLIQLNSLNYIRIEKDNYLVGTKEDNLEEKYDQEKYDQENDTFLDACTEFLSYTTNEKAIDNVEKQLLFNGSINN